MFIGHLSLAFAAKRATPRVSLPVLFVAAQFADTLWPILVGLGVEQVRIDRGNTAFTPLDFVSYPWSHSLLTLTIFGVAFGGLYFARTRDARAFAIIAALVVSHWVLDWITHRPDMPLYPGGAKLGLGLWNSIPLTFAVEGAMFVAGLWIYGRATRPLDGQGRWGLVGLVAVLLLVYVAGPLGGPPPSVRALWIAAVTGITAILLWSLWVDRHRTPLPAAL